MSISVGGDGGVKVFAFGDANGPNVRHLGPEWQQRFTDVLAAGDVVLSKPGYGIVSECMANERALLHLPRFGFAETELLTEGMDAVLPNRQISLQELQSDGFAGIARKMAGMFMCGEAEVNGAQVAASIICNRFALH